MKENRRKGDEKPLTPNGTTTPRVYFLVACQLLDTVFVINKQV